MASSKRIDDPTILTFPRRHLWSSSSDEEEEEEKRKTATPWSRRGVAACKSPPTGNEARRHLPFSSSDEEKTARCRDAQSRNNSSPTSDRFARSRADPVDQSTG